MGFVRIGVLNNLALILFFFLLEIKLGENHFIQIIFDQIHIYWIVIQFIKHSSSNGWAISSPINQPFPSIYPNSFDTFY